MNSSDTETKLYFKVKRMSVNQLSEFLSTESKRSQTFN